MLLSTLITTRLIRQVRIGSESCVVEVKKGARPTSNWDSAVHLGILVNRGAGVTRWPVVSHFAVQIQDSRPLRMATAVCLGIANISVVDQKDQVAPPQRRGL